MASALYENRFKETLNCPKRIIVCSLPSTVSLCVRLSANTAVITACVSCVYVGRLLTFHLSKCPSLIIKTPFSRSSRVIGGIHYPCVFVIYFMGRFHLHFWSQTHFGESEVPERTCMCVLVSNGLLWEGEVCLFVWVRLLSKRIIHSHCHKNTPSN